MNPEAARRALQAAGLTQRVELRDGGRSDYARVRREPGLAALATLGSGWIIGLT
jgi:hypothetical protein